MLDAGTVTAHSAVEMRVAHGKVAIRVRDVSSWTVIAGSSGSREGYWLSDPNDPERRGLVKLPRRRSTFVTGEAWAEYLAARVGAALRLSIPETELVWFRGQLAVLSWDFRPP